MKLYVVKESMNNVRSIIKATLKLNKESTDTLKRNRAEIFTPQFFMAYLHAPAQTIAEMNRVNNLSLPEDTTLKELEAALTEKICEKEVVDAKLKSIIVGLGSEGFTRVTYGLPAIPLMWKDTGVVIPFLVTSGIKYNAEHKKSGDALMDEIELELWEYEKRMAQYIDEDFTIDMENLIPFLKLFDEWMRAYCFKEKVYASSFYGKESMDYNLLFMGYYILFCNKPYILQRSEVDQLFGLYDAYKQSGIVDVYEAISLAIDYYYYELSKMDTLAQDYSRDSVEKIDPLAAYIEDGRVTVPCELEKFKVLLESSRLSKAKKQDYLHQMEDLLEYEAREAEKAHLNDIRMSVMSKYEVELYNLARCYVELKSTVENIDAAVEMLAENVEGEDRELLIEEIDARMSEIKRFFEPVVGEENEESVVYFTCKVEDKSGVDVRIPAMLRTCLTTKVLSHVYVDSLFKSIIAGDTARDRKVKAQELPCTVYFKGREVRVFYTKVKDTTVIIDMGMEEDGYEKIVRTVQSEEFGAFLREVQSYIEAGNRPNAQNYTDLLKTALNRNDKVMKLI